MGLRTPQQSVKSGTQALPGTRLQGGVEQVDNRFIQSAANTINDIRQQDAKQIQFLKDSLEVENENDRIQTQAELAKLEGVNALDQGPKLRERLKKNAEERLSKVPEKYRPYLQNIPGETVNKFSSFAYPYEAQQSKKLTTDVLKQRTAARVNEAVENSNDDFKFNESLGLVAADATRMAYTQYGEDMNRDVGNGVTVGEVVKQYQKNAVSDTVSRAIQAQIAIDRFDVVDKLKKQYGNELTPNDRMKVEKAISVAERNGETKNASALAQNALMLNSEDPLAQANFLRANAPNDRTLKESQQILNYFNSAKEKAKKVEKDKTWQLISDKVTAGQQLTTNDLLALPPEERGKAIQYATKVDRGLPIQSDNRVLGELTDRLSRATPEEAEKIDIPKHQLNDRDYNMLATMKKNAVAAGRDEMMRTQRTTSDVMNKTLESLAKERGIGKYNVTEWNKLKAIVASEWDRQLTFKPKNVRELRRNIEEAIRERGFTKAESPWWNFFGSDQYKVSETLEPETLEQDTAQIEAVKREASRYGLNWSDEKAIEYIKSRQSK